jgi:Zn-dependent protease with chaperone function
MTDTEFERLVARLDTESTAHPQRCQTKVALLALAGFGLLLLVLGVAGLGLLLLVALALAILFSGGKALLLLAKLGKLLIVLALPLWLLLRTSVQALFVRLPAPQGHELREADAPALFAAMAQMRRKMKGPRFHHVLITPDMNAAVVQRPLFGLIGFPRNYLLLGLPLLESLGPDEALAVVAHEYGHLAGSHGSFGAYIYRLRHSWAHIQALADQWEGWSGRLLQRVVGWYAPYFNAYTFVLARANEYEADRASAELVGPGVAAAALKRVNLAGPQHELFYEDIARGMAEQAMPRATWPCVGPRWRVRPPARGRPRPGWTKPCAAPPP